ncbi:glycoprotein [Fikirini virus]|uniref:Glycoprotein n=1 Tax=Fikirini virus TaxID=1408144 RepID=U5NI88_9RHAB|nr:glycoprotein [Fikirini virus]AGY14296.1 glycoprotein [Fikirini virus]
MGFLIVLCLSVALGHLEDRNHTPAPFYEPSDSEKELRMDGEILFPVTVGEVWKPVPLSTLRCPKRAKRGSQFGKTYKVFNLTRYESFKPGSVSGYLCHKIKWVTKCSETWYFAKEVSRHVEPVLPTEDECKMAMKAEQSGLSESGSYPPEECYWNAVNEEVNTEVHLTVHPTGLDPYTMEWVDEIFLKGRCSHDYCETDHSTVTWIRDAEKTNHVRCGDKVVEHAELSLIDGTSSPSKLSDLAVISHHIPLSSLADSCELTFCGEEGIQLANGIWFQTPNLAGLGVDYLSECPSNTKAGMISQDYKEDEIIYDMEEIRQDVECLNTLESIQATGTITYRGLQYFQPRSVGVHPVYRIRNSTVETNTAKYVLAFIPDTEPNSSCIGVITENRRPRCLAWNEWLDEGNGLYQGFNGLMLDKGKILYPIRYLLDADWNPEMHVLRYVTYSPHPLLHEYARQVIDEGRNEVVKDGSKNIGDAVAETAESLSNRLTTFFQKFTSQLSGIVGILAILMISYGIFKIARRVKKAKRPVMVKPQEIEMETSEGEGFG